MVTRMNFDKKLDLQVISNAIPGSEYDPLRFQGMIVRVDDPLASFILFESGVAIITDVVSEAKAKKAFKELETLTVEFLSITLYNVLAFSIIFLSPSYLIRLSFHSPKFFSNSP